MRLKEILRVTKETEVYVKINLDGEGNSNIETPIKFLNHMMNCFSTHSMFDIIIQAKGDLNHHIIEDIALTLGQAIRDANSDSMNILRFGSAKVPMDESLANVTLDFSGRPFSVVNLKTEWYQIEDAVTEDLTPFFESLAISMKASIHVNVEYGLNDHHKIEAAFKALALALRHALTFDPKRKGIPSSKGVI